MSPALRTSLVAVCSFLVVVCGTILQVPGAEGAPLGADVELPRGVRAVWDPSKAYRESTGTRERICINGLWRFRPAESDAEEVPALGTGWGYFKVPGPWPHGNYYMFRESQTVYAASAWQDQVGVAGLDMAWYSRDVTIPPDWEGRRIRLSVEYLNSYAKVFIDGRKVGEMPWPGGEMDITDACKAGETHNLAVLVIARQLTRDRTLPPDEARPITNRGLCGDVFLSGVPGPTRVADVQVRPSVRKWRLELDVGLEGLKEGASYAMRARVLDKGKEVLTARTQPFGASDLKHGRMLFGEPWKTPKLWDTDTPENVYDVEVDLLEGAGAVVDAYYPVRFGFREFWIEGRDFYLYGHPVHLRMEPLDSAQACAALASYEGVSKTLSRLKWMGFNAVYTHNYRSRPGSHLGFSGVLRAADEAGMLLVFFLPHEGDYDWGGWEEKRDAQTDDAVAIGMAEANGYARDVEWYIRRAQNHPSAVMYARNANYMGTRLDNNPDLPAGLIEPALLQYSMQRGQAQWRRRKGVIGRLDGTRPCYNHSAGHSGEIYTINCYLNWAPMQERAEWFMGWAERGAKPLCMVEYGEPLWRTWGSFRSFGRRGLQQWFYPEWGAAVWGDAAFDLSELEKARLRFEAGQWRKKQEFSMWDYPNELGARRNIANLIGVQAEFITHTWPAFRTLGVSGLNLWYASTLCYLPEDVELKRVDYEVDWDKIQHPGFSIDFYKPSPVESIFYSPGTEKADWVANERGEALLRYNQPLLAYIAGKPSRFTSKAHNFLPGQTVEKQIIVINDSPRTVQCAYEWSLAPPGRQGGERSVSIEPGRQRRIPVRFELPESLAPGAYEMTMKASFSTGEVQEDSLAIHVLPPRERPRVSGKIALFDPKGETAEALRALGTQFTPVKAQANLSSYDVLVIGKGALTVDGPGPDLSSVRDGLKVVVFEQSSAALERRLGFRVQEFGMRRVFTRVLDHPVLAGLSSEHLRDWNGEATLVPPRLQPSDNVRSYLMVEWCGYEVRRVWRCGSYGNVSSVMIEKPAAGDFMPLVDCGFGLQYSPLLEYREGKGMVLFCQVDVTGRTDDDPAAARLRSNIMDYVCSYKPPVRRRPVYAGQQAGLEHLKSVGAQITKYGGEKLQDDQVLVVGPGGGKGLSSHAGAIQLWLRAGGHVLAVGLSEDEARAFLPFKVQMKENEHISSRFEPLSVRTLLAGVGCGDLMVRDPREVPLVVGGAEIIGDGVLAQVEGTNVVFCQLVPWHYDHKQYYNVKMTFRKLSSALSGLLGNMGVEFEAPLLSRFGQAPGADSKPWLEGLYLDEPIEEDDPYRYFCW